MFTRLEKNVFPEHMTRDGQLDAWVLLRQLNFCCFCYLWSRISEGQIISSVLNYQAEWVRLTKSALGRKSERVAFT